MDSIFGSEQCLDAPTEELNSARMSVMIAEVYEASKEAGASEEKAKAAATVLAEHRERFDRIDEKLGDLDRKYDVRLAKIDGELAVLKAELAMVKWIVSGIGFGVFLLVLRSFWPA